jgi:outer membrane biosynthesis protein TonB
MSTQKQSSGKQKVLRIGVFQGGKFLEERLVRGGKNVTVGQGFKRNTFVIPSPGLPRTMRLIAYEGGAYKLYFHSKMSGRVQLGDRVEKLSDLARSGKAKRQGEEYVLALTPRTKGRVVLGEVTILFQFVSPPPARPKPVLPPHMRGGLLFGIASSGTLTATLLGSAFVQVLAIVLIVTHDWPQPRDMDYVIPDRFVQIMADDKKEEEDQQDVETGDGPEEAEEKEEEKEQPKEQPKEEKKTEKREMTPEERAAAEAERKRRLAEEVRNKTILSQIGALSPEGGSIADRLAAGAGHTSMDEAFANSTGVSTNAAGGDRSGLRTGGSADADGRGSAVGIGDLGGTKGTKKAQAGVGTGTKKEKKIKVRLNMKSPEKLIGMGKLDSGSVSEVLRLRQAQLQKCYERELKKNPKASGKVVVSFTIGTAGRVTASKATTDTVGGGVGKCVASTIKRFRFPRPKGGEVIVSKAFVFEAG